MRKKIGAVALALALAASGAAYAAGPRMDDNGLLGQIVAWFQGLQSDSGVRMDPNG